MFVILAFTRTWSLKLTLTSEVHLVSFYHGIELIALISSINCLKDGAVHVMYMLVNYPRVLDMNYPQVLDTRFDLGIFVFFAR